MNPLLQEELARLHLQELHSEAAERRRARQLRTPHSARFRVGRLLITLGEALTGENAAVPQHDPCLPDCC